MIKVYTVEHEGNRVEVKIEKEGEASEVLLEFFALMSEIVDSLKVAEGEGEDAAIDTLMDLYKSVKGGFEETSK